MDRSAISRVATRYRKPIPVAIQAEGLFRDRWLCHVYRRPLILRLALKYLAQHVEDHLPGVHLAYWDSRWRRDRSPLLDELGASVDHVVALANEGPHSIDNFRAICARCNASKSAKEDKVFRSDSKPWKVTGKYGEPRTWDGLSSAFVALTKDLQGRLTANERRWYRAVQGHVRARPRSARSTAEFL